MQSLNITILKKAMLRKLIQLFTFSENYYHLLISLQLFK
jgi:hypothetical protein